MLSVRDYYNAMDNFAPFKLAESWDNVGVIVGGLDLPASKVMLALDVTQAVLNEAVANGIDLIISHHPLMFSAIKKLDSKSIEYQLAKNGISLISAHTNLDATIGGVNDVFGALIGLEKLKGFAKIQSEKYYNISVYVPNNNAEELYVAFAQSSLSVIGNYSGCGFLVEGEGRFTPIDGAKPAIGDINKPEKVNEIMLTLPAVAQNDLSEAMSIIKAVHPYEEPAYTINENHSITNDFYIGRVGELEKPLSPKAFASQIKENLGAQGVQYTNINKEIKTVAICSGSGSGLIKDVVSMEVDAFVSGELKHDVVIDAGNGGIDTFQAGHFVTETIIMPSLKAELEKRIEGANVVLSTDATDGINFI